MSLLEGRMNLHSKNYFLTKSTSYEYWSVFSPDLQVKKKPTSRDLHRPVTRPQNSPYFTHSSTREQSNKKVWSEAEKRE